MTSIIHRTLIWFAVGLSFGAGFAHAEPLPLPSTDYTAKARMPGGMTMTSRHSNGKLRVEMQPPGMPQPMVSYLDLRTRKGVSIVTPPGMAPMAFEVELDLEGGHGVATGNGQRVGRATIAGESCDLWRVEPTTAEEKAADTVSCITADGVPLRVEMTVDGKRETMLEVIEISRAPVDAKLMTPPKNVQPMQLPKGAMPPFK